MRFSFLPLNVQGQAKDDSIVRGFAVIGRFGIVPDVIFETDGKVFVNVDTDSLHGIDPDGTILTDIPGSDVIVPELQISLEKFQFPTGQPRKTGNDRGHLGTIV